MIITREFAKNLDKKTLADLASCYATEFAHLLGHEDKITIETEEVIYNRKEARAVFLKSFKQPRTAPKCLKEAGKMRYEEQKADINQGYAFVKDGIAFIPITNLYEDQRKLVERIQPDNSQDSKMYIQFLRKIFSKTDDYVRLGGFGSEIAHLVGEKIYQGRSKNGLGEALDIASHELELSKDIKLLYGQTSTELDSKTIMTDFLNEYISEIKIDIILYETLLFEGYDATKKKMKPKVHEEFLDISLSKLKLNYVNTAHYDGRILFMAVFDFVDGDLNKTYRKLGSILSKQNVIDMESALSELGYTSKELSKYQGVFGKTRPERMERLIPSG